MKEEYKAPKMEIAKFEVADIIITSSVEEGE